jgi:hypothetical protein
MIASSIGLMVITVALVLWAYASRNTASLLGYMELSTASKRALDVMSQQIRNAKAVTSCSPEKLVLLVPSGTNRTTMTYWYNRPRQELHQIYLTAANKPGTNTLLTGCTNFSFSVFQRTPNSNSFQLTTNGFATNTAKVVQMQWTCLRKITGSQNSLENQVSAKVVIRNQ